MATKKIPTPKRWTTASYPNPAKKSRGQSALYGEEGTTLQVQIFEAVEKGNLEQVRTLHEMTGPAVRTLSTRSTLLHEAAVNNHADITRFLLKYISPNVVNKYGHTPAIMAAVWGHSDILKILLADEEINPDKRDCYKRTYKDLILNPVRNIKWEKNDIKKFAKGTLSPQYCKLLKMKIPNRDRLRNQLAINFSSLTMNELGPLRLTVKHTEKRISGPNIYRMNTEPRGYVCLISYTVFEGRTDLALEGSFSDIHNMASVFTRMGYTGEVYDSLSAEETKDVLLRVRDMDLLDSVGCGIFIVTGHGFGKKHFLTSDMKYLDTDWICSLFTDSDCPRLKGKPKLFIFDFCVGYYKGQTLDTSPSFKRVDEPLENMVCLYSGNGGMTSYTFTKDGTPFLTSLCRTLANHAHDKELGDFYRELLTEYIKTGPTTMPELLSFGFNKDFYFNPMSPD